DPLFGAQAWQFATETALGRAQLFGAGVALLTSLIAGLVRTSAHAAWAMVPVAWAIGWQATTAHAGGAVNHHLAVTAMYLHLAGSAIWLGLLAVLVLVHKRLGEEAAEEAGVSLDDTSFVQQINPVLAAPFEEGF